MTTLFANDPVTQLAFSLQENKGVFALLLGSGISRASQIPTGWEITLDLVRRVASAKGVDPQPDWARWYFDQVGEEPNYSKLLAEIAATPAERRSILDSYIEPTPQEREDGKKLPTAAHRAIASLVRSGYIRVILTTNFDRLMENALREEGIEPTVIGSPDALQGAMPLAHSACYLVKLHGDYKDARILNTDEELTSYPEPYDRLLDRIIDEYGLLICGWSGDWDHALRAAIERAPSRRFPTYFTARGEPTSAAAALIAHRQAKVVKILGADEFFSSLQKSVETLEKSQRPNPQSMELLIGNAKRFLSRPEYRIQLSDLISQEADRLVEALSTENFSLSAPWDVEEFRSRVARYESFAEPLARVAGVVGRWGRAEELRIVTELVKGLYRLGKVAAGGNQVWLNLRTYPAFLIASAYAVGLTQAESWKLLYEFFSAELPREANYGDAKRFVDGLFLNAWEGGSRDIWMQMEGFDRRYTPINDHLLDTMTKWKSSFAGNLVDFEEIFSRYENLGTLAAYAKADLAGATEYMQTNRKPHFWMPVGRNIWSRDPKEALDTLLSSKLTPELEQAGFGDKVRRETFLANFLHMASGLRFGLGYT